MIAFVVALHAAESYVLVADVWLTLASVAAPLVASACMSNVPSRACAPVATLAHVAYASFAPASVAAFATFVLALWLLTHMCGRIMHTPVADVFQYICCIMDSNSEFYNYNTLNLLQVVISLSVWTMQT